ncbi:hypothetical protein D9619_000022 [Psilocybe cf. subviscida]|uniref:Uncharacterized protein n=1 Tax=Psilocybe cf. subviscida TaxID=2480587 RepID=A0A8H5BCG2_9AGAR|nr:hypothetical protein D9619_000022 [Psilocybe cf. subviscida]
MSRASDREYAALMDAQPSRWVVDARRTTTHATASLRRRKHLKDGDAGPTGDDQPFLFEQPPIHTNGKMAPYQLRGLTGWPPCPGWPQR